MEKEINPSTNSSPSKFLYRTVTWNQETPFESNPDYPFPKYLTSFKIGTEIELLKGKEKDINQDEGKEDAHVKGVILKTGGEEYDEKKVNETDKVLSEKEGEEEEDDVDDEFQVDDKCHGSRKAHAHDGCSASYNGLSFQDESKCHDGIKVSTITQITASLNENKGENNFRISWIEDQVARKKKMKSLQSKIEKEFPSSKIFVFGCYQLEVKKIHNNFDYCYDGRICKKRDPAHVTVFPKEHEITGEYVKIPGTSEKYYIYCSELLASGWSPCCIRISCQAEPKEFQDNFNSDCWHGCRVIFEYIDTVIDYIHASRLLELLSIMEKHDYNVDALKDFDSVTLSNVIDIIQDLIGNVMRWDEAEYLININKIFKDVAIWKEETERSNLLLYGDAVISTEDEDVTETEQEAPLKEKSSVVTTQLASEFDLSEAIKVFEATTSVLVNSLVAAFVSSLKLLVALNCKPSCLISSVIITFRDIPNQLSAKLEKLFAENSALGEEFQRCVLRVSHLENVKVSYLAVSSSNHAGFPSSPVPQADANTFVTFIATSGFGGKQGVGVCKAISRCIDRMKELLWQRSQQRVMFLCLSSNHSIDIGKISTDQKSQGNTSYYGEWFEQMKLLLQSSPELKPFGVKVENNFLSTTASDQFLFLLVSFDGTSTLQEVSLDVVMKCLKRYNISVKQLFALPTISGGK